MKLVVYLITIAMLASVAALYVKLFPKSEWLKTEVVNTLSKKHMKREKDLEKQLLNDEPMEVAMKKPKPYSVPPLTGAVRAPKHPPVVFNELMVKTAFIFAQRKGQCRKSSCLQQFDQPSEQRRIYTKVLQDAHTGCTRRQIEACEVKGDILSAEGKYMQARESVDTGVKHAKWIVSRCASGKEKERVRCDDAANRHESLTKKSKSIYKLMLNAH